MSQEAPRQRCVRPGPIIAPSALLLVSTPCNLENTIYVNQTTAVLGPHRVQRTRARSCPESPRPSLFVGSASRCPAIPSHVLRRLQVVCVRVPTPHPPRVLSQTRARPQKAAGPCRFAPRGGIDDDIKAGRILVARASTVQAGAARCTPVCQGVGLGLGPIRDGEIANTR